MCADPNTHFFQPLFAQTACDAKGSGQTTGEMTAAGGILKTAVLDLGCVIRMTGAGTVLQVVIVA